MKNKTTTLNVEVRDRDYVNQVAKELDMSQRKVVSVILEKYRTLQAGGSVNSVEEFIKIIKEEIESASKRNEKAIDRIIGFIREQDKLFHNPQQQDIKAVKQLLQLQTELLSNLE